MEINLNNLIKVGHSWQQWGIVKSGEFTEYPFTLYVIYGGMEDEVAVPVNQMRLYMN